jgi:hypothetical protein
LFVTRKAQESFIVKIEQQRVSTQTNPELDEILVKVQYTLQLLNVVKLSMIGSYSNKIKTIKRDMNSISDRVTKMKKKADKLRQKKEEEDRNVAQKREKELERDRQLAAKPSKTLLEQSTTPTTTPTPPTTSTNPPTAAAVKVEKGSSPYLQAATKKN